MYYYSIYRFLHHILKLGICGQETFFLNFNIAKRYRFSVYFVYGNKFFIFLCFYNTPLFSIKLGFCSKFIASLLLIPLIMQQ